MEGIEGDRKIQGSREQQDMEKQIYVWDADAGQISGMYRLCRIPESRDVCQRKLFPSKDKASRRLPCLTRTEPRDLPSRA